MNFHDINTSKKPAPTYKNRIDFTQEFFPKKSSLCEEEKKATDRYPHIGHYWEKSKKLLRNTILINSNWTLLALFSIWSRAFHL